MISALFIAQSFPKWFVNFWMTFCKNSIRISCQIIFVNKHWPQSCLCPFKGLCKVVTPYQFMTWDAMSINFSVCVLVGCFHLFTLFLICEWYEKIWILWRWKILCRVIFAISCPWNGIRGHFFIQTSYMYLLCIPNLWNPFKWHQGQWLFYLDHNFYT